MELMPITELDSEEILSIINKNKTLADKYREYILDSEIELIDEQLTYIKDSADFNIGFDQNNNIVVADYEEFLDGVTNIDVDYGVGDETRNLIKAAIKIQKGGDTELFEKVVDKVAQSLLSDCEERLEEAKVHAKDLDDYWLDDFIDSGNLDDIYLKGDKLIIMKDFE